MEHHPSSNIEAEVYAFNDFKHRPAVPLEPPSNTEPWHSFHSRVEFEVAELALEAGLNNEQTNRLIKYENFTFKNHKDIHVKWEAASFHITKFTKEVISVPYNGKTWNFDLHYRDLWGLASDLLGDPHIFPHFTFDTQHLSKFDGETFVRFTDKPYTAQDFWDVQSQLLPGGKPLAFILYADKTRLSSFGTVKGYPVVAHLANLPTGIRNGRDTGSGYVVGWLPIVKEDKDYAGKPSWVNFKNAVWHELFQRITLSLASKSRVGQWFACMDGVECWCVISLTRGVMSLWPCPICLVPQDALSDTSKTYMRRTADDSRAAVTTARAKDTIEEQEEVLKVLGLRNIENALWAIQYSDVHRVLSHDRCHFNHGELWSCHYWVELQKYIARLGRAKVSQVDKVYQAFPRWRDLRHPNQVMNVSFADSAMHEDILKMIIYAMHNILMEDESPLGYLLLRCVQLYLEADIYAAFEVHTTATISAGRGAVQALTALMKQCIIKTEDDDKSDKDWNFPKLHMLMHLFDDIEAKGASRNYNTKPNEQMHGLLKDWQLPIIKILRMDHWFHVADDIRHRLLDLDDHLMFTSQGQANDDDDKDEDEDEDAQCPASDFLPGLNVDGSLHVKLGSSQAPQTFALIEDTHQNNDAFINFRVKLNSFLNDFLPACNIPLPDGKRIHLKSDVAVTAHQFLRVNFESLVDWRQHMDYLRCNPCFYNAPRFDCVFIQTHANVIIGRLLFLFDCPVGEDLFPLALVHPFDARTGTRLRKDGQLNLFRVRAKPRAQAEFFSVRSIIRRALLVHDASLDYLVVDTVDTDMFLRVKEIHLQAGHVIRI
ncbi:uncharacterized protein F5891DRAFT_1130066 [Suillus fuscotomentosus]|uniref:Uncharacterized protein n=1 Tax=Suillus fuscotomentosus TaxID=1912939 RepID=A0AAD4HHS8_9AGAM|nr:uncharacterized protein F5891DRAFT_1130066 [Suillus fuscotomentosus]KAG1896982.1 hypothetical protein F5891DRAFT_1130066 [Suillus fuscotomentosus]